MVIGIRIRSKEYINKIKPHLKDIIIDFQKSAT